MNTTSTLQHLLAQTRIPVIGAPMFLVSGTDLVVAQCTAGVIGTFPTLNARPQEELPTWLTEIKTRLATYKAQHPKAVVSPFGVNLIVHPSNPRWEGDLEICAQHEVPLFITSLHAPNTVVDRVHPYGGIVLHDVTNARHARKAIDAGVDGLILVASGHPLNQFIYSKVPYDTFKDFVGVTLAVRFPLVIGASASVEAKDLRGFTPCPEVVSRSCRAQQIEVPPPL